MVRDRFNRYPNAKCVRHNLELIGSLSLEFYLLNKNRLAVNFMPMSFTPLSHAPLTVYACGRVIQSLPRHLNFGQAFEVRENKNDEKF